MAEPKKNNLKNTLKEGTAEKGSKPKSNSSSDDKKKSADGQSYKSTLAEKTAAIFSFLYNERFQKIFGLTLLLFSIYLTIAFISYPFTWTTDHAKVMGNLFSHDVKVDNWLGKFGALLSHIFLYKWFGVSSFIFAF